jgi:DNA mismatch repair protein MutS2
VAIAELERYLSKALLSGQDQIHIVHGIGKGLLKAAVHDYLLKCSHIKSFALVPGNTGTTVVYL